MKIKLAYGNVTACEKYRIILPASQMSHDFEHAGQLLAVFNEKQEIVGIKGDWDLVVIPRPAHKLIPSVIKALQSQGIAVVCEIDDDLQSLSPHHSQYKYFDPSKNPEHNWRNALLACNLADRVIVTTDALAERYGRHGRVDVIPNYIPDEYVELGKKKVASDKSLVWGGIVDSHPRDLQVVGNAVERLSKEFSIKFRHVGTGDASSILRASESVVEGKVTLDEWPVVLQRGDIGLAPLETSKFNDAKSSLKPLEYVSLGLPCVVSSTPSYDKLGAGITAKNPRQWYAALRRLVEDNEFYAQEQQRGLELASHNTISKNYHKWEESWDKAIRRRKDDK